MGEQPDQAVNAIVEFLNRIGLKTSSREISGETFLPGIRVERGLLVYDPEKLKYPGDLLHEAGHLALLPTAERNHTVGDFKGNAGNEMGAIAWSYAACLHLGLPIEVLFHEDGYKGDASWLAETFAGGSYIGLPILEWKGLASAAAAKPYPQMQRWLCP